MLAYEAEISCSVNAGIKSYCVAGFTVIPIVHNTAGLNRLKIKCVSLLVAICCSSSCNNCTTAEVIIVNFDIWKLILKYLNTLKL